MLTAQDLIERTQNFYHLWNAGHLEEAIQTYMHPDFFDHASPPGLQAGLDNFRMVRAASREVLADLVLEPQDIRATHDGFVTARMLIHATHVGPYRGLPATQQRFSLPSISEMRWDADGLMVEHWEYFDFPTLLQQLGGSMVLAPAA